jgi:hypothetical protein
MMLYWRKTTGGNFRAGNWAIGTVVVLAIIALLMAHGY